MTVGFGCSLVVSLVASVGNAPVCSFRPAHLFCPSRLAFAQCCERESHFHSTVNQASPHDSLQLCCSNEQKFKGPLQFQGLFHRGLTPTLLFASWLSTDLYVRLLFCWTGTLTAHAHGAPPPGASLPSLGQMRRRSWFARAPGIRWSYAHKFCASFIEHRLALWADTLRLKHNY